MPIAPLNRSVFHLSGEGLVPWLESIITNSLKQELTFTALLTPQGKIIADFFVTKFGDALYIDTPTKFAPDLFKRLRMYKLRAPIDIKNISDTHSVYAIWNERNMEGVADPRHPAMGNRIISHEPLDGHKNQTSAYNAHRLSLGIPESEWDFETVKVFPADANMDLINGVDFQKGCFVGQEVVSRMKRMTTVKKRMRGVVLSDFAEVGDRIMAGERVIGDILSINESMGMAMIRLDRYADAKVTPSLNGANVKIMDSVDGQQH